MAYSNYDASTTNKSKRSNRIYADLNLSFTKNPATKDVARLFDVQAIKRSVKNIILTNKYERPFNSDFGCNLRGFLFENITEPLLVIIKDRVAMAIEKYEPRVTVEDVVVRDDQDKNGISIMVGFYYNKYNAELDLPGILLNDSSLTDEVNAEVVSVVYMKKQGFRINISPLTKPNALRACEKIKALGQLCEISK